MPIRRSLTITAIGWTLVFSILVGMLPAYGQTLTGDPPKLVIKLRDVERFLRDLEALVPSDPNSGDPSSRTAMIRGMLQGTSWIDPSRSIVARMHYDGQATSWRVLVPFQTPNENFQGAYGAIAGEDYYVVRFPPSPEPALSDTERSDLVQASAQSLEANLVMDIAAHDVLVQSEGQIEAAIQGMATSGTPGGAPVTMAPEEIQQMARDFITTFKQVDRLRLGLSIDPEMLLLLVDVKAKRASFLEGVLKDPQNDVRIGGYQPEYPMVFRSRAYNVAGVLQLLGAGFGQLYTQWGLDVDEMVAMAKSVTGEMAGGMALDQNGMTFEMIYALHDPTDGEEFLTQVYLPWFEAYNRRMAAQMEDQTGQPEAPLYARTPDTIVAGKKVIGVRTRFPALTPAGNQMPANTVLQDYPTRMTVMDGFVLAASSDAVIAKLIEQVAGFRQMPAQGSLAVFSMDMGAYLRGLQRLMPDADQTREIPSDIGALTMRADLQDGELMTRTRLEAQDLQQLGRIFARLTAPMAEGALKVARAEKQAQPPATPKQPLAPEILNTPAYWMDRGGLLSAYGSYQAAVRSYQKALDLAPGLAEAHFQQGVAFGELGQFDAAIRAISRAIDQMPDHGPYYYGRARVYLLAGDEDLAMNDFMEAGFRGHEDARAYLKGAGVDWD